MASSITIRKPRELMNVKLTQQKKIYAAQDFVDGVLYYGFKIEESDDKVYLVSKDSVLGPIDQKAMGLLLWHKDFASRFPVHLIEGDVFWHQDCETLKLHEEITEYLSRTIYLPDKRYYPMLSSWVMNTYIFMIYSHFPYLHLNADKGSGKTTLMKVLFPIAFNGDLILSPNSANLFRIAENNQATMFIDEAESLGRSAAQDLLAILKSGYAKGAKVPRSDYKTNKQSYYSTYCPKVFGSINDIDHVLNDRIIRIMMMKGTPSDGKERYIPETFRNLQEDIMNRLYLWGLKSGGPIFEIYKCVSKWSGRLKNGNPRLIDLWAPFFCISEFIYNETGNETYMKLYAELAEENFLLKVEEDKVENHYMVIANCLRDIIQSGGEVKKNGQVYVYDTDFVYDKVLPIMVYPITKSKLSRMLKVLGIRIKEVNINNRTTRCYYIDENVLLEYINRYSPEVDPE